MRAAASASRAASRSLLPVVGGIAAALLAVSACGEPPSPRERLSAASRATTSEGTAVFSLRMEVRSEEGGGGQVRAAGEGALDFDAETARMEMTLPGAASSIEMVFDGDVVYVRMPPIFGEGEPRWIRREVGAGADSGAAAGFGGGNPLRSIATVEEFGEFEGEIERLGSGEARGTRVEGYRFSVRPATTRGDAGEVPESIREMEIPTEVWLDRHDRVRRTVREIDLEAASRAAPESASGTLVLTIDLYDFGDDVEVAVPEGAEAADPEVRTEEDEAGGP